jgi:type 2 lantibiotic biosynthesis protein LanM
MSLIPPALSHSWLSTLARNAAPLSERIRVLAHRVPQSFNVDSEKLLRWRTAVAGDEPDQMKERLSWDGLDATSARHVLEAPMPEDMPLPSWASVLADLLTGLTECESPDFSDTVPFAHALLPLVNRAVTLLDRSDAPAAILAWARKHLTHRISRLFGMTMETEFNRLRPFSLKMAARIEQQSTDQTLYLSFCRHLLNGGFVELFERYPVLGRLTGVCTELWITETREFICRFASDCVAIQAMFGNGGSSELAEVAGGLSDPHKGGREVRILSFADGTKVVYKSRSMDVDIAWTSLLEWLRQFDELLPLWHPRVLKREGYGWIEFVRTGGCPDLEAVRRYYRRTGMLLGVGYALCIGDIHYENLLVAGEQPVLVDLETVFVPERRMSPETAACFATTRYFERSVLSSLMLPFWKYDAAGAAIDLSAFAPGADGETLNEAPAWRFLNTDLMYRALQPPVLDFPANAPAVNGTPVCAHDYVSEMVDGFQAIYRVLMAQRLRLAAADGPLARFRGCSVRILLRATEIYARLQRSALAPRFLTSGIERSLALEPLYRTWLLDCPCEGGWRAARSEIREMENLDIPYFAANCESTDLETDGQEPAIARMFEASGWQRVHDQIAAMTERDMERQSVYIRASFDAKRAGDEGEASKEVSSRLQSAPPLSREELIDRALGIARDIRAEALTVGDETTWIGLMQAGPPGKFGVGPLGIGMWSGTPGVGLFFAACYAMSGDEELRHSAMAALKSARESLTGARKHTQLSRSIARSMGPGGGEGVGSVVLALVRAAKFLGDAALVEDARDAASHITPEMIAADDKLDFMAGSAGALLALLTLREAQIASGQADPEGTLRRAVSCGDHLVAAQREDGAWPASLGDPMFGFAHGAAGIACSLARLHGATGTQRYHDSATAGIRFEHRGMDRERGNWVVKRNHKGDFFMGGWCSGSPGVGLARLSGMPFCDSAEAREDIDVAARYVESGEDPGVDHICCGSFGHVEYLLASGRHERAVARASWIIGQAQRLGGFRLFARLPRTAWSVGLGQGLAGIGYQMLRLADSERVPSLLFWK